MKQLITLTLLCIGFHPGTTVAQDIFSNLESGIVLSTRATTGTDQDFSPMGYEAAVGYYWLKPLDDHFSLSIDARLSYGRAEKRQRGFTYLENFFRLPLDTFVNAETGEMDIHTLALSIPLKLRYQPLNKVPLFILVAYEARLHLYRSTDWAYDEILYRVTNSTSTLVEPGLTRSPMRRFYSNAINVGLGFRSGRWMVEATVGEDTMRFNDNYIQAIWSRIVGLNAYYRL